MLVKTAQSDFPHLLLKEFNLERGEWLASSTEKDGITLRAYEFQDLKVKDFISTCATSIPGKPRAIKHLRLVPQPQLAEHYLKYAPAINIHNHYRSSTCALKIYGTQKINVLGSWLVFWAFASLMATLE